MRHGRDTGGHGPSGRGRRPPPPATTGEESVFLARLRDEGEPVVLHLADGGEIRGRVIEFDRDSVVIGESSGRSRLVRKSDLRYVEIG